MRKLLLTTAAVSMLAATGASAQVLAEVNSLVQTIVTGTSNVALAQSVAVNTSEIDGSITIGGSGLVGGSVVLNNIEEASAAAESVNFDVSTVGADAFVGGTTADITAGIEGLGVSCDISAGSDALGAACLLGATGLDLSTSLDNTITVAVAETTTMDFGDVSATALGAVNSGAVDMAINGAATASSSASRIGTGAADAAFSSVDAASVVATSAAVNTNDINGSVSVDLLLTSASFNGISTTAAGAINSGDVTGSVNGVLASIVGE